MAVAEPVQPDDTNGVIVGSTAAIGSTDRQGLAGLLDAVEMYFDALYFCDTGMLSAVFHPSSSLFDGDGGKLFVENIASFSDDVGGRVSPSSRSQTREEEILSIDFLSPASATVKVRLRSHRNVFLDHLGFVQGEDGWRIVSKIWTLEKVVDDA